MKYASPISRGNLTADVLYELLQQDRSFDSLQIKLVVGIRRLYLCLQWMRKKELVVRRSGYGAFTLTARGRQRAIHRLTRLERRR